MSHDKGAVRKVLDHARSSGRTSLTAPEAQAVCEAYGIPVPREEVARNAAEGKVVTQGEKDFLLNDPVARRVYLGETFQM